MNKLLLISLLIVAITSCASNYPDFDAESAFSHLEKQCDLGVRYPGSDGIELCREYIINELTKCNAKVESQKFSVVLNGEEIYGENIIASFYPQMSRRILFGAHYDTRPWADKEEDKSLHNIPIPGANDGASGVAVLLELAEIVAAEQPAQFGVDLVFFDLEDSGTYGDNETWCLGSSFFAEHYTKPKPEKAIVIDMIGDADLSINIEHFSYHNSPNLVREVWNIADKLEYSEFKSRIETQIYDDHYPLIAAGFNAIDIIDFEYPVWHTLEDTPDKCSPHSLKVVGQTMINLIYQEK
ncbi:MAG: M28 family peptidase [Candidatus Tenebribacter davisii]|nr:M28 family peptidase [Candidatus Tenebribacter davisii]